jgi:hypothetical protein
LRICKNSQTNRSDSAREQWREKVSGPSTKLEILTISTMLFEQKYAPWSQSKRFLSHRSMPGDGDIDPTLICGHRCGQYQQVYEPTCRGDHVGEKACIDQAAGLGSDEKQTMRLEKSCTRMLDNTI